MRSSSFMCLAGCCPQVAHQSIKFVSDGADLIRGNFVSSPFQDTKGDQHTTDHNGNSNNNNSSSSSSSPPTSLPHCHNYHALAIGINDNAARLVSMTAG